MAAPAWRPPLGVGCDELRRGAARGAPRGGRHQRQDHVLPIARHDDQGPGSDSLQHVLGLHGADRDIVDDAVEVGARRSSRRARPRGSCRASDSRGSGGTAACRATGCRGARGRGRGCRRSRAARRGRPCSRWPRRHGRRRREQGRVEDDLVDRPADAALAHDDRRRTEHRRDGGVREADDRTDSRVAGALDQDDVAVARELPWAARTRAPRSSTTSPAM